MTYLDVILSLRTPHRVGGNLARLDAEGVRDYNGMRGPVPTGWDGRLSHIDAIYASIFNEYLNRD